MAAGKLSEISPLLVGRVSRVLAGAATLGWTLWTGIGALGLFLWLLLVLLGASFLVGGLMGNPGCEITALPNLFLPKDKRLHSL